MIGFNCNFAFFRSLFVHCKLTSQRILFFIPTIANCTSPVSHLLWLSASYYSTVRKIPTFELDGENIFEGNVIKKINFFNFQIESYEIFWSLYRHLLRNSIERIHQVYFWYCCIFQFYIKDCQDKNVLYILKVIFYVTFIILCWYLIYIRKSHCLNNNSLSIKTR